MALVGLASATVVEAGSLPLGSSLVGIGRVARTISMLWETSLFLEGSLGAAGGLVALKTTPLVVSFSFSATPTCSASLGGLLVEGRVLAGTSFLGSRPLGAVSVLESEGPDAWMAGGQ